MRTLPVNLYIQYAHMTTNTTNETPSMFPGTIDTDSQTTSASLRWPHHHLDI